MDNQKDDRKLSDFVDLLESSRKLDHKHATILLDIIQKSGNPLNLSDADYQTAMVIVGGWKLITRDGSTREYVNQQIRNRIPVSNG